MEEEQTSQLVPTPKKRGKSGKPQKPGPKKGSKMKPRQPIVMTEDKIIIQAQRLDLFLEEFVRNGGNATRAANAVFNCKSIAVVAKMGSDYLSKARGLGRVILEKKGYSYGKLLEVAVRKMEESKTPEWFDRLMKLSDYHDFLSKEKTTPQVVNIVQGHRSVVDSYIDGEVEDAETTED